MTKEIKMVWRLIAIVLLAGGFSGTIVEVSAQDIKALRQQVNKGTVALITGGVEYVSNTYVRLAGDLAAVLDEKNDLRVLPVMGYGAVQNVTDVLFLQGIDIGMVHSDVLTFLRHRKLLYPVAERKLRYIVKLYDEVFHVIAHEDIQDVYSLTGKKVAMGAEDSGSHMSSQTLFGILGIKPEVVHDDWRSAVEKLKSGEIAAMVYPTQKPSTFLQEVEGNDQLHFLPLPATDELLKTYSKVDINDEDYPNLMLPGTGVQTLQFATVLVVYNWNPKHERYQKVSRFVRKFFGNIEAFKKPPYDPTWQKVDIEAEVLGWKRFGPAQKQLLASQSSAAGPVK